MPLGARTSELAPVAATVEAVAFSALPGWDADDHLAAFRAFVRSAPALGKSNASGQTKAADALLIAIAREAAAIDASVASARDAKAFFETRFTPHRVVHNGAAGLLTGYYEPVLQGARAPHGPDRKSVV